MPTVIFTTAGTGTWTAPPGCTGTVAAECWGASGGGGDVDSAVAGGGGGGGEYAREPALAVTAGDSYSYTVGAGGAGGSSAAGSAGGNSTFAGDSVTVTAHGGSGGGRSATSPSSGGAGGTGSSNTVHFDGGAGAAGTGAASPLISTGGGGGSSAGPSSAGNPGSTYTGGAAPSGGGPGGNGGQNNVTLTAGSSGGSPGGGGGGQAEGGACADTRTEIFTQRGWLAWDQVAEGDRAWAVDPASGDQAWSLIARVRIYPGRHDTVVLSTAAGQVVSTAQHRHVVRQAGGFALAAAEQIAADPGGYQLAGEKSGLAVTAAQDGETQTVWCPTTDHGTWLARRNGLVFFTGNKP